jgi:hypothetical protein
MIESNFFDFIVYHVKNEENQEPVIMVMSLFDLILSNDYHENSIKKQSWNLDNEEWNLIELIDSNN